MNKIQSKLNKQIAMISKSQKFIMFFLILSFIACGNITNHTDTKNDGDFNNKDSRLPFRQSQQTQEEVSNNLEILKRVECADISKICSYSSTSQIKFEDLRGHEDHKAEIKFLELFELGNKILILSIDSKGLILIRDNLNSPKLIVDLDLNLEKIAYSKRNNILAFLSSDEISIFKLKDLKKLFSISNLGVKASNIKLAPDMESLLFTSSNAVYRWKFDKFTSRIKSDFLERYNAHSTIVSAISFHNTSRIFFSADWSGDINAWLSYEDKLDPDFEKNRPSSSFHIDKTLKKRASRKLKERITDLELSLDAKNLFVVLQSGKIELWSVRGFSKKETFQAHSGLIKLININSRYVTTYGRDGSIKLWKFNPNEEEFLTEIFTAKENGISTVLNTGSKLYLGTKSGKILKENI